MIRRIKPGEAAFRHGSKGREPIAPPSDQHVHYTPSKRSGIGCITSRESKITFFELLAYELEIGRAHV